MLENDLHVSLQSQALLLLLSEQKDHAVLLLAILFLGWVRERLSDV